MKLFTISTILTFLSVALAAPFPDVPSDGFHVLDVIDPRILSPTAKTVWVVGNSYNVTWDTTDLPPISNITNTVGMVVLGQFNGDGEKLFIDNPLANGFLILNGHVRITVPKVPDGNYMIVLFGDSGNTSPQFKIVNNPLSSILDPHSTGPATTSSSSNTGAPPAHSTSARTNTSPSPPPTPTSSSPRTTPTTISFPSPSPTSTSSASTSTSIATITSVVSVPFSFSAPTTISGPSTTTVFSTSTNPSTTPPAGSSSNGALGVPIVASFIWLTSAAVAAGLTL